MDTTAGAGRKDPQREEADGSGHHGERFTVIVHAPELTDDSKQWGTEYSA